MSYAVKEIFKTLQGEGQNAGRVAVFVRFAGCNLWSGREKDRKKAVCKFCDTKFLGGRKYKTAADLVTKITKVWGSEKPHDRFIVFTGGEPLLQIDGELVEAALEAHFRLAVETNGTIHVPRRIQHLTVSPKAGSTVVQREAEELKFVFPQDGMTPEEAREIVTAPFNYLQPMDGPDREANTQAAVEYCIAHPWWRLSLQTHKFIGLP